MKNLNECPILKNNISTLKDTSKDTSSDQIEYMTNSLIDVINFDAVKCKYLNDLGMSEECAKSVDAIYMTDDEVIFIEFKNGSVTGSEIRTKINDSLLIFSDIVDATLSDSREHFSFILVYSQEKNSQMCYRDARALHLANRSNQDFIGFGLAKLEGFFFKKVEALLPQKMESKLIRLADMA